jgi:rhodanese-related sulfurtransferase
MSKETWDTLGRQKQVNYALRAAMTRDEFIGAVTEGLVEPPQYFPKNAVMNKMGYESIDVVRERGLQTLSVRAFKAAWAGEEALVIDARHQDDFAVGFVPGSIFIGIYDNFAPWVGTLVPNLLQPILFVADPGTEEEIVTRLARVGYDNAIGYLEGGFDAWIAAGEEVDRIEEITAAEFARRFREHPVNLLDVRRVSEFDEQHIVGAVSFPLDHINRNMAKIDREKTYYLHCGGGYRSMIAASILKARGVERVINIREGFKALRDTGLPMTEFVEQVTEL